MKYAPNPADGTFDGHDGYGLQDVFCVHRRSVTCPEQWRDAQVRVSMLTSRAFTPTAQ